MASGERPSPEEIVLYDKDPATKIATITFNRPDHLNAPTSAARLRYADLLRGATVDDDVKVVVIRGVGEDLGSRRVDSVNMPLACAISRGRQDRGLIFKNRDGRWD